MATTTIEAMTTIREAKTMTTTITEDKGRYDYDNTVKMITTEVKTNLP